MALPELSASFEPREHFYFQSRFIYFDWDTGQIKSVEDINRAISDFSGFSEDAQQFLTEQHKKIADAFSDYVRFSICMKESDLSEDEAEMLKAFGVDGSLIEKVNAKAALPFKISDVARKGRPRIRDEAADAYWEIYPDGHKAAGISLKGATNAVSDKLGQRISDDTLRRVLGKKT